MTGTDPRMSSSIQVGLTALDMLTTTVLAFGADMLVIVLGKKPVTYGAQLAGDALTAAAMMSNVNSRSLELSVCPLDHFHGLTVMDIVLPPFDQTGGLATLSVLST